MYGYGERRLMKEKTNKQHGMVGNQSGITSPSQTEDKEKGTQTKHKREVDVLWSLIRSSSLRREKRAGSGRSKSKVS